MSGHQRGASFDIHRVDDMFAEAVIAAVKAAGVRVLDEGDVLHVGP